MLAQLSEFSSIWIVVVGLSHTTGNTPRSDCVVAGEMFTDRVVQLRSPQADASGRPPYPMRPDTLFVGFEVNHVLAAHLSLCWPLPLRVIDLAVEFRNLINGRTCIGGPTLFGALTWYGLPSDPSANHAPARINAHKRVSMLRALLVAMAPNLDVPRALLRGRYMTAVARIERAGIPLDGAAVRRLSADWQAVVGRVVSEVDKRFGFYPSGQFDVEEFANWTQLNSINWPRQPGGILDLSNAVFSDMARQRPELRLIKELRKTQSFTNPRHLKIGEDGRNRVDLRPFASRTGRNQPRHHGWVFGAAAWMRHLIKPRRGFGLALIDWDQQEFGIAAALSQDLTMQEAYRSGDPYLALARRAGSSDARKDRQKFKACALAAQYGGGPATISRLTGLDNANAVGLLEHHAVTFRGFWRWSDDIETHAVLHKELSSVFGWKVAISPDTNPRFLRNFPMQANGAEILRLASCLATENGIRVCATLHDALLIEANVDQLQDAISRTQADMRKASEIVLDGFSLRSSVCTVSYPERYRDGPGGDIWDLVSAFLSCQEQEGAPVHQGDVTRPRTSPRPISLYVSKRGKSDVWN